MNTLPNMHLSVNKKTRLNDDMSVNHLQSHGRSGGVGTSPLFENLGLTVRPNWHRNSGCGVGRNCLGDSTVQEVSNSSPN